MKWSIKDMMAITVIVALIFVARTLIKDVAPSYLILALYLGVATVASSWLGRPLASAALRW